MSDNVEISKYFKFVSSYAESEIATVMMEFSEVDRKKISTLTKSVAHKLKNRTSSFDIPKKQKQKKRADKEDIFYEVLRQLRFNLVAYDLNDKSENEKIE